MKNFSLIDPLWFLALGAVLPILCDKIFGEVKCL